jgi:hypothetical protein
VRYGGDHMGNIELQSADLPKIDESIKKVINQGLWYLYKINHREAQYMLIADGVAYFLSQDGTILFSKQNRPMDIEITESVYFSNLPSPVSLSNLQYA